MHLHMAKARYQNAYEKNNFMKFVTKDKKITRKI